MPALLRKYREALPMGRRSRRQSYSAAEIQACLTLKVLFGFAHDRRVQKFRLVFRTNI
jgi:hypothetical protein